MIWYWNSLGCFVRTNNDVTYFDSFEVEYIPKEIKTFINNKNIKTNTCRIQAYDSIMCGLTELAIFFNQITLKEMMI